MKNKIIFKKVMICCFIIQLLSTVFLLDLFAFDQDKTIINTDRSNFTGNAHTVPFNSIILESGYTFTRFLNLNKHAIGELLFRIGVFENVELRFGINSISIIDSDGTTETGKDDGYIGIKFRIFNSYKKSQLWFPSIAFQIDTFLPVGNSVFSENSIQPVNKFILSWNFYDRFLPAINLGYALPAENGNYYNSFYSSLNLKLRVFSAFYVFSECVFKMPETSKNNISTDVNTGLEWFYNKKMILDLQGGKKINSNSGEYYVSAGTTVLII